MERFFGTLKRERTSHLHFTSHEQARSALFEFIEAGLQSREKVLYSGLSQSGTI